MTVYKTKYRSLTGSSLSEVMKIARREYHVIQKKSPRRIPYIKSKYFTQDKIFINNFWDHLNQKPAKERVRRLKLYCCALDLLRNTKYTPVTIYTGLDKNTALHRFYGQTIAGTLYCVQVKENKRNNRKEFISVFPVKKML